MVKTLLTILVILTLANLVVSGCGYVFTWLAYVGITSAIADLRDIAQGDREHDAVRSVEETVQERRREVLPAVQAPVWLSAVSACLAIAALVMSTAKAKAERG